LGQDGDRILNYEGKDVLMLTPKGEVVAKREIISGEDGSSYATPVIHVERSQGAVRVVTSRPHDFKVNDCIALTNTGNPAFAWDYPVFHSITSVLSPNAFTFQMDGPPASAEKGEILPAGFVDGLKIVVADAYTSPCNPAPTDHVAIYSEISTGPVRKRVWGSNPITDVQQGFDGTAWGTEIDINNYGTDQPEVGNNRPETKYLVDAVSGGSVPLTVGFHTNVGLGAGNIHHGLWLSGILDRGIVIDENTDACNLNRQQCIGMPKDGLWYGEPTVSLPNRTFAVVRQWANGDQGLVFQRNTDAAPIGNPIELRSASGAVIATWNVEGKITVPQLAAQMIATETGGNTDLAGEITFSSSNVAYYRFRSDNALHPECVAQPQFDLGDGNRLWLTYDSDMLTAHLTKASTGKLTYQCIDRTAQH
jgi:hypothetical protein